MEEEGEGDDGKNGANSGNSKIAEKLESEKS